ncbi:MBG domain-containing protein, partial [Escherichia coli]|uniref:MBG domain-containing protein n=1 Tax=Escherichia coli TaxID=562 RepID=UPI0013D47F7C
IYGDANPALTWQVTSGSLVNGDNLTGNLATSATTASNVGSYAITQGDLAASSNYAVTYAGANLAVSQRAITVTADAKSRIYGDANP